MKDLIDFMKLTGGRKWDELYPMLRDAYGEHASGKIPLKQTRPYLASLDLHTARRLYMEEKEVRAADIRSPFIREHYMTGNVVDNEGLKSFVFSPASENYYDIMFVISIIENEQRRDNFYKKVPLFSSLVVAAATIMATCINVAFTYNISGKIDALGKKVEGMGHYKGVDSVGKK